MDPLGGFDGGPEGGPSEGPDRWPTRCFDDGPDGVF